MKILSLIFLLAVSAVTIVTAQVDTNVAPVPGLMNRRDITLQPGALTNVVEQLEAYNRQENPEKANDKNGFPRWNLIWSPGTAELPVPTILRLSNVEPIDALSLAAAAAGCKLEKIESTKAYPSGVFPVIGYKVVRMEQGMGRVSSAGGGMGFDPLAGGGASIFDPLAGGGASMYGSAGGGGVGLVRGVGSGNPYAPSPASVPAKALPGLSGNTKVTTVTSTARTTTSGILKDMQEQLLRLQQTHSDEHPRIVELKREMEAVRRMMMGRSITRVYAMGGIIAGTEEEKAVKLLRIQETINLTVQGEEIDQKSVQVNYHEGTKVLVVKAPEAAQELVGQLIDALRENAKVDTANSKPNP